LAELCPHKSIKKLKTKKMITASHDAKEGKAKSWMYTVGAIVVGGIITGVLFALFGKHIQKLEQAMS
jgi:hypothetical protein